MSRGDAGWDRLGVGDLIALWVKDRSTAMNVAMAGLLDPGPLLSAGGQIDLPRVRADVADRLDRVPSLRRRIRRTGPGQGRPVWVDDQDFDIGLHVFAVDLPGADLDAFLSWAASWAACRLSRDRPLWRICFVSGLASGEIGVVVVVHHAMADGVAGAALAAALLDGAAAATVPRSHWRPSAPPTRSELARDAATRMAELRRMIAGLGRRRAHRTDMRETLAALQCTAPGLPLPAPSGDARVTASVSWPLADVRAVAHAHGATVNDLMLAAVAAGMHRLLETSRLPADDLVLRVSVPVAGAPGSRNATLTAAARAARNRRIGRRARR
jgi:diacylglycerol O-acyltransferase